MDEASQGSFSVEQISSSSNRSKKNDLLFSEDFPCEKNQRLPCEKNRAEYTCNICHMLAQNSSKMPEIDSFVT